MALKKLGCNCYHGLEMTRENPNGSIRLWKEAIEAKFYGRQSGKLETGEDFDLLLWRYNVS